MNQLYYGDNLQVLREHLADESVDLIYLDPPFNSKRESKTARSFSHFISKIAQRFNAGFVSEKNKSPVGTKEMCLPSLTGLMSNARTQPSHKWLGYFQGGEKQRAEHPDYEPDLNFKKAKTEANAAQKELGV
jgi:hypothetical protein